MRSWDPMAEWYAPVCKANKIGNAVAKTEALANVYKRYGKNQCYFRLFQSRNRYGSPNHLMPKITLLLCKRQSISEINEAMSTDQ